MKRCICTLMAFICIIKIYGQEAPPENWFNLDATTDQILGVSTEKAYSELLKGKKSKTVVVAVIDSGIDVEHEDLKDIIWKNTDEIPNNEKDDDGNGYVDDVHGWNFQGGSNGENVAYDNLEITRLYRAQKKKYDGVNGDKLKGKKKKKYQAFKMLEEEYENKVAEYRQNLMQMQLVGSLIKGAFEMVEKYLAPKPMTVENVLKIETDDPQLTQSVTILQELFANGLKPEEYHTTLKEELEEGVKHFSEGLEYYYNLDYNPRKIVGDNYSNSKEKYYGNNDVIGPDAHHGTHVGGIIAAVRNNTLGINGIADNVQLMVLRAVPNGDERDKDVANAIRYAVDNGAKVINMSFGKGYAYDEKIVNKAIKYAMKKDVLLVHGSGNDGEDIDKKDNFPNDKISKKKYANNWIEVGATSWQKAPMLPANFSNFGKKEVDIFAPGVAINSTVPGSEYKPEDGTSMASPVVAGVAALVRSYYPHLKATQVKEILMKSAIRVDEEVASPGSGQPIPFSELSVTGGVVNAYAALKLAETYK